MGKKSVLGTPQACSCGGSRSQFLGHHVDSGWELKKVLVEFSLVQVFHIWDAAGYSLDSSSEAYC